MPESKNHYSVGQSKPDRLIEELVEFCEPRAEIRDLLREILTTSVKLGLETDNAGEMKLINSSLKEMRYALKVFCAYEETRRAVIFGSARTPESDPCYQMAMETAKRLTEVGWMTITGAGGGIMEAGNRGAADVGAKSIGLNIVLPHEQAPNEYVTPELCFNFHYFAIRKMHFLMRARVIAVFPPHQRPDYEPSKRRITFHNGAMASLFSSEEPDRLRGPQCEAFWAEELAHWKYPTETFDMLMFGWRLGTRPRGMKIITAIKMAPNSTISRIS